MNDTINLDPMEELDIPYTPPAYELWGRASLYAWYAALIKGEGKVPYDPNVHKSRVTAVDITISPIVQQNAQVATRNTIRESREWGLTQSSLQACGIAKSAEINDRYVRVTFEPTGETYINANGETKNKTHLKFQKVFTDEKACLADYISVHGEESPAQPAQDDKEYKTALQFLTVIVKAACKGETEIATIQAKATPRIASTPLVAKYFTVNSDEFINLMAKELGAK